MVTCKEAHALIAHAVDGRIALAVFEPLRQHLAVCASCREALDTQRRVKAVLAARPSEALPDGFAARLAARLDAEPLPHVTGAVPAASVPPSRLAAAAAIADAGAAGPSRTRHPRDRRGTAESPETRDAGDARRRRRGRAARDTHPTEQPPHLVAARIAEARPVADEHRRPAERELVREIRLLAAPASSPGRRRWRDGAAWRAWSLRLLPIAAALVLFAGHERIDEMLLPSSARALSSATPAGAPAPPSATDDSVLEWLARPSTTVDSLLVLGATGARGERTSAPLASASTRTDDRAAANANSARMGTATAAAPDSPSPASSDARGEADARQPVAARYAEASRGTVAPPKANAAEDAARVANAWPAAAPVAAGGGALPGTVVPNAAVPTVLADRMAQELRLTDEQRKQIEAIYDAQRQRLGEILEENRQRLTLERAETDEAVERVLTPRQRKRYRDMNANRGPALPVNERALPPSTIAPGTPGSTPQALPNGLEITITPADPPRPPFMP